MASSLKAFAMREKRAQTCLVCQLPAGVRREIVARSHRINLPTVVAWLATLGHTITVAQLLSHTRDGHNIERK